MSFLERKVKVLPLPDWVREEYEDGEFEPDGKTIFGRDGWYFDRFSKVAWVEWDGLAKIVDAGDFLLELDLLNSPVLRDCEIQALEVLARGRVLSKEMREILYANNLRKEIWETGCETYIYVQKILNDKN